MNIQKHMKYIIYCFRKLKLDLEVYKAIQVVHLLLVSTIFTSLYVSLHLNEMLQKMSVTENGRESHAKLELNGGQSCSMLKSFSSLS